MQSLKSEKANKYASMYARYYGQKVNRASKRLYALLRSTRTISVASGIDLQFDEDARDAVLALTNHIENAMEELREELVHLEDTLHGGQTSETQQ